MAERWTKSEIQLCLWWTGLRPSLNRVENKNEIRTYGDFYMINFVLLQTVIIIKENILICWNTAHIMSSTVPASSMDVFEYVTRCLKVIAILLTQYWVEMDKPWKVLMSSHSSSVLMSFKVFKSNSRQDILSFARAPVTKNSEQHIT